MSAFATGVESHERSILLEIVPLRVRAGDTHRGNR